MLPGISSTLDEAFSFLEGDAFSGVLEFTITELGIPPSADAVSAKMQFRPSQNGKEPDDETTVTASIAVTVDDGPNWEFSIAKQLIPAMKAGQYVYAVQVTDANSIPQTYIMGKVKVGKRIIL